MNEIIESNQQKSDKYFRLIIMASGFSRRFQSENKLLASFRGESLCMPAIRITSAYSHKYSKNSAGLLVSSNQTILDMGKALGLITLENPFAHLGQSESIKVGINHDLDLPEGYDEYAVFIPADQPLLKFENLEYFLDTVTKGTAGLWRASTSERSGSPTAFHRKYYPFLNKLKGDSGGKSIFSRFPSDTKSVRLPDIALEDVDTVDDLKRLLQITHDQ